MSEMNPIPFAKALGKPSQAAIDSAVSDWLDDHPEATTTVEDGSITKAKLDSNLQGTVDDVADLKSAMETKANVDGSYEQMTVGNAEQLVSTVGIEDKVPYNFRTAGGANDIGDRENVKAVVGVSYPWNQLVTFNSSGGPSTDNGITYTRNADGSVSVSGTATASSYANIGPTITTVYNHKIFICGCPTGGSVSTYYLREGYTAGDQYKDLGNGKIIVGKANCVPQIVVCNGTAISGTLTFKPQIFDLTQMFGSTIADYIYSLEQSTAGAGVAWFRKLFPKPYYAYNAGQLMSVSTNAHKMVGFNQFDGTFYNGSLDVDGNFAPTDLYRTSDYIRCVPNTTYFYHNGYWGSFRFYDASKNHLGSSTNLGVNKETTFNTPANAHYMRFQQMDAGSYDTCINLSWDGERDGEYEPYEEHTYPLDDVELRGIPKLDANNDLYYDGDSYEADGTVTRKYGIVDLGTLEWIGSSDTGNRFTSESITDKATVIDAPYTNRLEGAICSKYSPDTQFSISDSMTDKTWICSAKAITIKDTAYTDAATFKTAMSGVYLVYELATPTTEEADPYQETQICNDFGTEEFVDTRTVPMPVGHASMYQSNLRAKLEMAPDSPDGSGDFIVRQTNGTNEYVALSSNETVSGLTTRCPACPTGTDGTFTLKATVSSGSVTYSWESDS